MHEGKGLVDLYTCVENRMRASKEGQWREDRTKLRERVLTNGHSKPRGCKRKSPLRVDMQNTVSLEGIQMSAILAENPPQPTCL